MAASVALLHEPTVQMPLSQLLMGSMTDESEEPIKIDTREDGLRQASESGLVAIDPRALVQPEETLVITQVSTYVNSQTDMVKTHCAWAAERESKMRATGINMLRE